MNAFVYHVASGQAFFSGVALIFAAIAIAWRTSGRWWRLGRTILAMLGLILITISSTPVPLHGDLIADGLTLGWIGIEGVSRPSWRRTKTVFRWLVLTSWLLAGAMEVPFHLMPKVFRRRGQTIYVVGDSLSAGIDAEAETWPRRLARTHDLDVRNLSMAGANSQSALKQADRVIEPDSLVLVEIGGNDLLAEVDPKIYEAGLESLLAKLASRGRTVVVFELPLIPFHADYGAIQRRVAKRHGAILIPKRVLIGAITAPGGTIDSLHLSKMGHARLAEAVWSVLRGASKME